MGDYEADYTSKDLRVGAVGRYFWVTCNGGPESWALIEEQDRFLEVDGKRGAGNG